MNAVAAAAIAFAAMLAAMLLGMLLRTRLPEHYLSDESKEVVRLGTALIATMSAMLLGLLITSTRSAYEEKRGQVIHMTADLIELDMLMKDYGPEGVAVRQAMRDAIPSMIDGIWRAKGGLFRADADAVPDPGTEAFLLKILQLAPHDDDQRARRERALQVGVELAQIQLVLFAQPANAISAPFITLLVLWLAFIFVTFSVSAPPNGLIVVVLTASALSAASAIFLILDLDSPFAGLLQIPNGPLRNALPALSTLVR